MPSLIDELLREQHSLTAVERFARSHDRHTLTAAQPRYSSLLPLAAPAADEQYAFEVDLDKCSGCKACVTACHSLNGLEENETWRSVGLLTGNTTLDLPPPISDLQSPNPDLQTANFDLHTSISHLHSVVIGSQQHVTTACHHCADPGCLNGCPVLAYDKDPVTGIVRHLDDQCIGCQYCVLKCPYDVPKYSKRLGIVRKCDLCTQRLAVGEAPACAQACPNEAIRITLVERHDIRSDLGFPPDSPDPSITRPTTRFRTARAALTGLHPADAHELRLSRAHWPLSVMLVLTQMAIGAVSVALFTTLHNTWLAWTANAAAALGMIAATLHLGQPMKAWRGFLGWRKSWLSRELIAFGAVMPLLAGYALTLNPMLAAATAAAGVLAVYCSAMIYVDTRRAFWSAWITFPKFGLTTMLLGSACAWAVGAIGGLETTSDVCIVALLAASILKLCAELTLVTCHTRADRSPLRKSALLHVGLAGRWFKARLAFAVLGGVLIPSAVLTGFVSSTAIAAGAALALNIAGEIIERHLFFVCESSPQMPGGIAA
jgi:formate dehydrogenase iron-sulfur subunit